jgi:NAD(P)-dependent dehydrogenase (short-subunit alcohol dehydrogenase family)
MANKVVFITGANRGLGKEVARQLALKSFHVLLSAREYKKAKKAAEFIIKQTGNKNIIPFKMDLTSSRDLHTIATEIKNKFEHIDVLINNAGVLLNADPIENLSRDILEKTMESNFYGPLLLTQKLLPLIKKSKDGRVINVSSGMGSLDSMDAGHAAYRISKTSLNGFTATLAAELEKDKIKVMSVCPGWVQTDMGGKDAIREIETGGKSISQLAWKDGLESGKFYRDGRIISW